MLSGPWVIFLVLLCCEHTLFPLSWIRFGCFTFCHHMHILANRKDQTEVSSFDRLWLLIGQFYMLNQPKVRFSVPLVEKLLSSANWLSYFLFCFLAQLQVSPQALYSSTDIPFEFTIGLFQTPLGAIILLQTKPWQIAESLLLQQT